VPPRRVAEASKSPGSRVAGGPKSCGKSCGSVAVARVVEEASRATISARGEDANYLTNRSQIDFGIAECCDTCEQLNARPGAS